MGVARPCLPRIGVNRRRKETNVTTRRDLTSDTASQNQLVMIPLPQLFDRAVVTVASEVDIGDEAEEWKQGPRKGPW